MIGFSARRVCSAQVVLRLLCLILPVLICAGCVQDTVVIKVNPDGSGIIEETITSKTMIDEMKKECSGKYCPSEDTVIKEMTDKTMELARKNVDAFGEGVRLVSVTPVKSKTLAGSKAIYGFDDINKITVSKDPLGRTASGFLRGSGNDEDRITFSFKKDPSPQLVVTMYPKEWLAFEDKDAGKRHDTDDDKFDRLEPDTKELMRSGKLSVILELMGNIEKTNATYRSGSHVTLIDVSFATFVDDEGLTKKFMKNPPRSIKEYKEAIRGVEGFKLELNNPLVIDFK